MGFHEVSRHRDRHALLSALRVAFGVLDHRADAADDRFAIIATLDRYAECLDQRDWPGLADVFTDDVEIDCVAPLKMLAMP